MVLLTDCAWTMYSLRILRLSLAALIWWQGWHYSINKLGGGDWRCMHRLEASMAQHKKLIQIHMYLPNSQLSRWLHKQICNVYKQHLFREDNINIEWKGFSFGFHIFWTWGLLYVINTINLLVTYGIKILSCRCPRLGVGSDCPSFVSFKSMQAEQSKCSSILTFDHTDMCTDMAI